MLTNLYCKLIFTGTYFSKVCMRGIVGHGGLCSERIRIRTGGTLVEPWGTQ